MRPDQPEADEPDAARPDAPRSTAADGTLPADRGDRSDQGAAAPDGDRPRTTAVSRAEQLAEHDRLRRSVENGATAADQHDAWVTAAGSLREAWEQHKERYPDRARAVPVTGQDGSWECGRHRRLDPEQNTEATKAHADLADEAGRHILPALRRIEAADPGRKLAGLEHMVKGEDRFKEKLAEELSGKGKAVREAVNEVPDAARFTLCYDARLYSKGVQADVERLKAEGFELIKLKNLWTDNQYKGINSQWRRPESGSRFEMQFHTPASLEAKELTHQAYERIRSGDVTPAERSEARAFQREVNKLLSTPPGTDRIKDYPERTDG